MDDTTLHPLTRRQEEILALIIESYTANPEPVSSRYLQDACELGVSSATIRNEMALLEEKGLIRAPHTSAGRVPTEDGYRYFVSRLMTRGSLTAVEESHITESMRTPPAATEQWMRLAATLLARTARSAALVTAPISEASRFKHLELISIQGRLVLMVLVLHSGNVHQQMLTLVESPGQTALAEAARRLNAVCLDQGANEVRMKSAQLGLFEREIAELAADVMERSDTNQVRFIYRDGLSGVLSTFQDSEGAEQAVRVFEERAVLNLLLSEVLARNDVQVFIAGDGRWEELNHLSMVLSRYGIPGQVSGALGVVGPTHINYGRAVGAVRHVSNVMTDVLARLLEEGDEAAEDVAQRL
ncbi:MAG: heat-inducible transcriptional repressor HrcA [Anaerolineaceae bacterium]|nr:heat-inducible transcriptional repressor HrcA [Anaerolineaceae bacterium]